jgi:hypothetical protein
MRRPDRFRSVVFATIVASLSATSAACGSNVGNLADAGGARPNADSASNDGSAFGDGGAGDDSGRSDRDGTGDDGGAAGDGAGTGDDGGGDTGAGDSGVGDSVGTIAVSAVDFLDSIGVCAHIGQGVDAAPQSAIAMSYAGIRGVRDDGNPAHVKDLIAIHQQAGVRTCLLTDKNVTSTVSMAKELNAAGALLAVEGPNEPNNFPVTYEAQTSAFATTFIPAAHFQRDLYSAVKAEPSLSGIPVFHSSEAGGSEPDNVGLQFLTIPSGAGTTMPDGTKYADYANVHNYVCGHSSKLVDNVCWNATDPTLNGDWDGLCVEYGKTWHGHYSGYSNVDLGTVPKVTTETGWVTTGTGSITQEQQGRVFLNLYLSAFKRGWAYTFIYMLRDDPNQGYWGLFDTNYNPKTSGTYLHNMTTILSDIGPTTPGRLNYSIATQPVTVHDLLIQKSSGRFELAVWNERPSGGSDTITVGLGAVRSTVNVYDPTTGTTPTQTLKNVVSVQLTLTDHPVIIEL